MLLPVVADTEVLTLDGAVPVGLGFSIELVDSNSAEESSLLKS